jgi:hypothetical protein
MNNGIHSGKIYLKKGERYKILKNDKNKNRYIICSEISSNHYIEYNNSSLLTFEQYRLLKLKEICL